MLSYHLKNTLVWSFKRHPYLFDTINLAFASVAFVVVSSSIFNPVFVESWTGEGQTGLAERASSFSLRARKAKKVAMTEQMTVWRQNGVGYRRRHSVGHVDSPLQAQAACHCACYCWGNCVYILVQWNLSRRLEFLSGQAANMASNPQWLVCAATLTAGKATKQGFIILRRTVTSLYLWWYTILHDCESIGALCVEQSPSQCTQKDWQLHGGCLHYSSLWNLSRTNL